MVEMPLPYRFTLTTPVEYAAHEQNGQYQPVKWSIHCPAVDATMLSTTTGIH
jgi:hypothetical protein